MSIAKGKKEIAKSISIFLLCCAYFTLMIYVADSFFQTFKDIQYNIACMALLIIVMLIRKDFKLNKLAIVPSIVVVLGAINYIYDTRNDWGIHYKTVLFTRYFLYALILLFLLSLFINKNYIIEYKKNVFGILCAVFVLGAGIMEYTYAFRVVYPLMLVLFVGRIEKSELKKLINIVALSMYATFLVLMTCSLIIHPEKTVVGRYEGMFNFPIVTGLLSSIGIISSLHFIYESWVSSEKKNINKSIVVKWLPFVMLAYATVMLIISTNRATLLGILLITLVSIAYFVSKMSKNVRLIFGVLALAILVCGLTVFAWMSHNFEPYGFTVKYNIGNDSIAYYFIWHLPMIRSESTTGVFAPGTVGDALDSMSSDRVGIWVTALKQITLFGKNPTSVALPNGAEYGHVHSTLIDWLLRYGAICGSTGLVWLFSSTGKIIYDFFYKKEKWMLSFLISIFSIGVFLVEKEAWAELLPTTMILLQYRFFYDIEEDDEKADCREE